jgi:integrase
VKKYDYSKNIWIDGKRYYIRADSPEELGAKIALKRRDIEEGRITISGSMTVAQWIPICISTYKPRASEETKQQTLWRLQKHVIPCIGGYPLKKVKPIQLQGIMNEQAGASSSHIKKLSQEIKFIFARAVENKLILESPAEHLSPPIGSTGHRRALTATERKHFLRVCEKEPRFVLFELMLYCGCRPSEAAGCIGADVQEINGFAMLHIRGTKTYNSDRYVPVPEHFAERLKTVSKLSRIATGANGQPIKKTAYIRLTERLKREMNLSMGCRTYRNALVPPFPLADDFVPYNLRHTYCTDLQKAGVDVRTAQKLMGHADIRITANIYTHIDLDSITDAARLINTPTYTPTAEKRVNT